MITRFMVCLLIHAATTCGADQPLTISWTNNMLRIAGPNIPGDFVEVWYIEAFCRSGSTDRRWEETTIPHRTELISASPSLIKLRTKVEPAVIVDHTIRARNGEVEFHVQAKNDGDEFADVQWFQPCIRVDRFTGRTQMNYHERSFIFTRDGLRFLHQLPREQESLYRGGQVFVPAGIPRGDVNPRPISRITPVNDWIGCVSADSKWLLATAWNNTQELFQGVIVCLHNDPRIGGLNAGESRELKGKVVILPNDPNLLLKRSPAPHPTAAPAK